MTSLPAETPLVIGEVIAGEGVLSIPEVAQRFRGYRPKKPKKGETKDPGKKTVYANTHVNSVMRWVLDGIRRKDGSRLYLEACKLGGRWLTSEAALARFIAGQTPAVAATPIPPAPTPRQRHRKATKASQRLDAIGI